MGTPLACKLGKHHWETQQRQFDVDEPVRTVLMCTRCQRVSTGESGFARKGRPESWPGPMDVGGGF